MTTDYEIHRDLGELFAFKEQVHERLDNIETKIDQLIVFQSNVNGGYRVLLAVAAAASTLASLLTAAVIKLKSGT